MLDENTRQNDAVAVALRTYAQNVLVVIFGLLPLFFIPTSVAPFDYTKASIVVLGLFVALVLYSLSILRSGVLTVGVSYTLCALWATAGVAFLSSLLSGDFKDSLIGDLFSIHSTVFVALLALIPTVWLLIKPTKTAVMRMYILLAASTLVLVVFHTLRLFFGSDFLSFGIFTSNVATPVGSWNDLALFLGLTVLLSLVALEQLALTKMGKILFAVVTIVSLIMLGIINFFTVWLVLGITSLVLVVYSLGKDRFAGEQPSLINATPSKAGPKSLAISLVVFAISTLFVIGGATFGGWLSKYTGISYVEVRPSLEATADIARSVYHENAFLGTGANKFTDAWRLYKDNSINTTAFWNTDFNAGNSYITTFFVTTGVLGGLAWAIFLAAYFVTGVRKLLGNTNGDKVWYFIGVSSFASAVYIWGMSVIYVPGVVILLLGALCTGVSLYAFNALSGQEGKMILVGTNRKTGFVLTLAVITIIIGSVSVLYVAGRHYSSVYTFNESIRAMQKETTVGELEQMVASAYQLSSSDIFARRIAEYQLARMNRLISLQAPTDAERQEFQAASINGVRAAQEAINIDEQEPTNWSILAGIYGVLATVGVEGAQDRALEALSKARELNPKNPLPYLESAVVEARSGNLDAARGYIDQAIGLKSNFTEAFYLLSQIEVAKGNIEGAIQSTQAIIQLEPQNAARYYQLGVLRTAQRDVDGAIVAFEQAVARDQNYANARYLLALSYDEKGRSQEARQQLEEVLKLNPDNEDLKTLLNVISTEGSLSRLRGGASATVTEATPTTEENGTVSTSQTTDTTLVTPVNTAPKVDEEKSEEAAQ